MPCKETRYAVAMDRNNRVLDKACCLSPVRGGLCRQFPYTMLIEPFPPRRMP